jgi:hypothetical protein
VDLSKLFSSIIGKIIRNKELPSGKTGYYFAENGSQSWESIARAIGKAGRQSGGFTIDDIFRIKLEEVASEFYNGDLRDAEGVLASKYVQHIHHPYLSRPPHLSQIPFEKLP